MTTEATRRTVIACTAGLLAATAAALWGTQLIGQWTLVGVAGFVAFLAGGLLFIQFGLRPPTRLQWETPAARIVALGALVAAMMVLGWAIYGLRDLRLAVFAGLIVLGLAPTFQARRPVAS